MLELVSAIIPHHNRVELCKRAIDSVLQQDYPEIELILIDDGSTDDVNELEAIVVDSGGSFINREHLGVAAARNFAAAKASGKYLAFIDSDDLWLPSKISRQVDYFEKHSDCRICQTKERWIRNGKFVNSRRIHAQPNGEAFYASLPLCCISPSAVMLEKSLFESFGGFDPRLIVCEDYDLWLRITSQHKVPLIEEVLVEKHGGGHDQLSRSQVAIDRFRIFSLLKLLAESELSSLQEQAAADELVKKCQILVAGATKRGNNRVASLYQRLADNVTNNIYDRIDLSESLESEQFLL